MKRKMNESKIDVAAKIAKATKFATETLHFDPEDFEITEDGKIDVIDNGSGQNDVYINGKGYTKIPVGFVNCPNTFDCSNNKLTTLENAPTGYVGWFQCSDNKLKNLIGCPEEVDGMECSNNELESLEGAPKKIWNELHCHHNNLTSLKGCPQFTDAYGKLDISCNDYLESFEGIPKQFKTLNISYMDIPDVAPVDSEIKFIIYLDYSDKGDDSTEDSMDFKRNIEIIKRVFPNSKIITEDDNEDYDYAMR